MFTRVTSVFSGWGLDRLRYCGVALGAWAACAVVQWASLRNLAETGLAFDDTREWSTSQGLSVRATGAIYLVFMAIAFLRFHRSSGRELGPGPRRVYVSVLVFFVWICVLEFLFFFEATDYAFGSNFERNIFKVLIFSVASMIGAASVLSFTKTSLRRPTRATELAQVVAFAGLIASASVAAVLFLRFNYRPVWFSYLLFWQVGVTFLSVR